MMGSPRLNSVHPFFRQNFGGNYGDMIGASVTAAKSIS
jgi:cobalamin synthase